MVLLTAKYDTFELIHIHFNTLVFKKYLLRTYMRTVRVRVFSEYRCIICICILRHAASILKLPNFGALNSKKEALTTSFILWQIHPFREGNTRTTAVFTIQYLRSMKYSVTNDLFKTYSWYFRNALVRANYKNVRLGIDYDISFLERFFRNLLMDEQYELKNRYMLISAPNDNP